MKNDITGIYKQEHLANMNEIAPTPKPPYYAVIFTSHRTSGDNGYNKMANKIVELASQQPGFLGVESARETVGITVSYWKHNLEHLEAITANDGCY